MLSQALQKQIKLYRPAILLDEIIEPKHRKFFRSVLGIFLAVVIVTIFLGKSTDTLKGIFFLLSSVWLLLINFEFFYNSHYFRGEEENISFELAALLEESRVKGDVTLTFLQSDAGRWILLRSGVGQTAVKKFLAERGRKYSLEEIIGTEGVGKFFPGMTLSAFLTIVLDTDHVLKQFILSHDIKKEDIAGAADWFERREAQISTAHRWWSEDELGRIPGLAKDWAYGQTFFLDKFGQDLVFDKESVEVTLESEQLIAEEKTVETILSRPREANVLIIGDSGGSKLDVVYYLARKIREGSALPEIEHRRLIAIDTLALIAATREKSEFEKQFIIMLNEAVRAGNIILVFKHFPEFIQSAKGIGSDVAELLDPYLTSSDTRVVALADHQTFSQILEPNAVLMNRFEKVTLKELADQGLIHLLEHEIERYEATQKFFFTYGAIRQLAQSIEQYFDQDGGLDKARDLVDEMIPRIKQSGKTVILKEDILALVEQKTGIPLGKIDHTESEKLLKLESILHERIIGQDEAIKAISNAMRRARSGINNPNRPIGSFLFLGPTGVGKTETTKALAHTFFGKDDQILRLDMSEYKGADALSRLMGSFENSRPGILSEMLRDKQYGVLLLDEFEKTGKDVQDLFLQILDEGFFSDMNGKKVNARNTIIIATSNAASDLIFKSVQAGENLEKQKPDIINAIVAEGMFRPELLNRFDAVILFHPLDKEHLTKIADLMLKKLAQRLEDKGITLVITPELVDFLITTGTDTKFGARSMNRAIQETVEQAVAKKIISGEALPGSTLSLTAADLQS